MVPYNTYSWCSCLMLSPPTLYQGGSMWPTEYGASKCVSLLRLGCKKRWSPSWFSPSWPTLSTGSELLWPENAHAAYGEVKEARHKEPARNWVLPTTTWVNFFFLTFYSILEYSRLTMLVIVSGGQQRDSAIHIHVSILPQTPLPSRLPHSTEQSFLSCTVGHCWLSILNITVLPVNPNMWVNLEVDSPSSVNPRGDYNLKRNLELAIP